MSPRKFLALCLRLCFALFFLLSSAYLLVAYIPFTRPMLIQWNLKPGETLFSLYHSYLYWVAFAAILPTIIGALRPIETRRLAAGFLGLHAVVGIGLLAYPVLIDPPDDERSFIRAILFLFPLAYLAVIDVTRSRRPEYQFVAAEPDRLTYKAVVVASLFVSILYATVFLGRYGIDTASAAFGWREQTFALWSSITCHLFIFTLVFAVIKLSRLIAARTGSPRVTLQAMRFGATAAGAALVIRSLLFPALVFEDYKASIYALSFCFAIAAFLYSTFVSLRSFEDKAEASKLSSFPVLRAHPNVGSILGLCPVALFAYFAPIYLARADWNSVLQKFSVLPVWIVSFLLIRRLTSSHRQRSYPLLLLLVLLAFSVAGYRMLAFAQAHISSAVGHEEIGLDELLDQYAAYDISYSVSRSLLSTLAPSRANTPEDEAFYDFLRRSSLLPKSSAIRPAKLDLVEHLESAQGPKPNIFIFVVDSLRQDYLSPYNRAVTFTPEIEKFSHESIVMGNAFTRYGGTGLSEPSIWTGTMQLHEQYVQPFYSMNNLQKLVETDGYQPYVSVDQILKELIRPSPEIEELDKNVTWYRFDLADTLTELRQKIDLRRESNRPIFAFSQALNVHLMGVKTIQANESLAGEVPKGVDRQHAVQVRRVDRALGEFIQFLKTRGLYDNSIIVLTSDHGDSLGEEGHWGHINSLYPEIMRVPLIIHLPPDLQKSFVWDQSQVAFNTDIVPTLYYILGHRSILNDDLLGRPLLTETKEELQSYIRDNYLVASSYGPVYGLLSDNGRSLFVADAQQRQDFLYDLSTGFNGSHKRVSESARSNYRHEIHEYIEQINRRFNFTP